MSKTVYVVTYLHRHGRDMQACATRERAHRCVGEFVREQLGELEDEDRQEVEALLQAEDYLGAARRYVRATESPMCDPESFEIDELPVLEDDEAGGAA